MKGNFLSFVFIYFLESGLFKGLWPIQIKNTFLLNSRLGLYANRLPWLLPHSASTTSLRGSKFFDKLNPSTWLRFFPINVSGSYSKVSVVERGIGKDLRGQKKASWPGLSRPSTGFGAANDKPLLLIATMSASSLRRRCVDGRDKPRP
jgi:hypothetical protein